MSEIQTPDSNEQKFRKATAAAAAGLLGLGVASTIAIGQAGTLDDRKADALEAVAESSAEKQQYIDTIREKINAEYDSKNVIGEILVTEGSTLISGAEKIVETTLGADLYNEMKDQIYDPLLDSAQQYSPQPGETYYVVEVDIDPEKDNGNEYLVTDGSGGILHTDLTELPSPIQANGTNL